MHKPRKAIDAQQAAMTQPEIRQNNRMIEYRGKRKLNGTWVTGSLISIGDDWDQIIPLGTEYDEIGLNLHRVISDTIGQFVNVLDNNGAKIFEGDIVTHNGFISRKHLLVKFLNGAFCIGCDEEGWTEMSSYVTIRDAMAQAISKSKILALEVIGNIYDNPELLQT